MTLWLNLRPKICEKQRQCFHFVSVLVSDKTYAVEVNLSPVEPSLRSRHLEAVGEREKGRARGRHERGEGAPARKALEIRFNSHSVSADISNFQLVERLPREKFTVRGEKTVYQ